MRICIRKRGTHLSRCEDWGDPGFSTRDGFGVDVESKGSPVLAAFLFRALIAAAPVPAPRSRHLEIDNLHCNYYYPHSPPPPPATTPPSALPSTPCKGTSARHPPPPADDIATRGAKKSARRGRRSIRRQPLATSDSHSGCLPPLPQTSSIPQPVRPPNMPSATISPGQFDSIPAAIEAFRTSRVPLARFHPARNQLLLPPQPSDTDSDTDADLPGPLGNGEFLVVLDDPSRENEADLIVAAHSVTTEQMAFMVRHSSGLICAPISSARADALSLPLMVPSDASEDARGTAYTISVDAADPSVTTGISSHDRALTCRVLAADEPLKESLRRPGHVFPLRAREGGVRVRGGHTEAATEFCRLAGRTEAAVICEIVDDGEEVAGQAVRSGSGMLRGEQCIDFARKWGLKVCTIADLVEYVEKTEGKLQANGSA